MKNTSKKELCRLMLYTAPSVESKKQNGRD